MKQKLFVLAMIIAASLAVQTASAQVRVSVGVGINEATYPGYTYYTYPAWHGHYRDRVYYDHYHARFYREHRGYFVGGPGRFDHARYERETHWHHH